MLLLAEQTYVSKKSYFTDPVFLMATSTTLRWTLHTQHYVVETRHVSSRQCEFKIHNTFTWQRISSAIVRLQHRIRLISSGLSCGPICPTRYSACILILCDWFIVAALRSGYRYEVDFVVVAWRECGTLYTSLQKKNNFFFCGTEIVGFTNFVVLN
jgi:hypothetical protein